MLAVTLLLSLLFSFLLWVKLKNEKSGVYRMFLEEEGVPLAEDAFLGRRCPTELQDLQLPRQNS